jgi:small subunit ribosomal protein S17
MARKKKDEEIAETQVEGTDAGAVTKAVDTEAELNTEVEAAAVEVKPKKTRKAATKSKETDKESGASDSDEAKKAGKRAEKIGVVSSDKMMKTVTVRVDRLVKHPVYRKYVKRRKKFMAHDDLGAKIGDKVRIVETRPLSARKRWRVIEIIQKAEL